MRPLTRLLVAIFARLGFDPLWVLAAHGGIGLVAAGLIASGHFVLAALLLQLKTLLDNSDGGLARATGRVTQLGRYADTSVDFVVNLALFAALARYGPWPLALGALLVLTLILSLDFRLEARYWALRRQAAAEASQGRPAWLYRFLHGLYQRLFAPQDALVDRLDDALLTRLTGGKPPNFQARLAWNDLFSTATLVNLGLSSQLVLLGLCLILAQPFWYVYAVYGQLAYVAGVQVLRAIRFRHSVRRASRHA
jgi:archaetidylinositol phosphate synthase